MMTMIISKAFQGKFFGDYIDDVFNNYGQIKIPDFKWEDDSEVVLLKYDDYCSADRLRFFLKIFDIDFPKMGDGTPFSMRDVSNSVVINHIDYIRYVLAHNGSYFTSDSDEWNRLIELYNR